MIINFLISFSICSRIIENKPSFYLTESSEDTSNSSDKSELENSNNSDLFINENILRRSKNFINLKFNMCSISDIPLSCPRIIQFINDHKITTNNSILKYDPVYFISKFTSYSIFIENDQIRNLKIYIKLIYCILQGFLEYKKDLNDNIRKHIFYIIKYFEDTSLNYEPLKLFFENIFINRKCRDIEIYNFPKEVDFFNVICIKDVNDKNIKMVDLLINSLDWEFDEFLDR